MPKPLSNFRFESREIAVILSLFIFVSLLMFTVGIVVGKGLAQAKFEGLAQNTQETTRVLSSETTGRSVSLGTSISSHSMDHPPGKQTKVEEEDKSEGSAEPSEELQVKIDASHPTVEVKAEPLELKPKKMSSLNVQEDLNTDLKSPETEALFKNPKLRDLFEPDSSLVAKPRNSVPGSKQRAVASVGETIPPSYAVGNYTVQVASYSDETQASERVKALKTLGFPFAYLSTVELGENKETWFRVWLGYYPSFESAKAGGEALQARGEVKNYLVRKSETTRSKN